MLTALLAGLVFWQTPAPPPRYTLEDLVLEATPDFESGRLEASATLTLRLEEPTPSTRVPLDVNRWLRVRQVRDEQGRELSFLQEVTGLPEFEKLQLNRIEVSLPTPLPPGGTIRLSVDYEGWIAPYTETGMLYVRDHVDEEFTVLRADAWAFPLPPGRGGAFTFQTRVWVPPTWVVATGGRPTGTQQEGPRVRWDSESLGPAPFLLVTIARYHVEERESVRVYAFPADTAGARHLSDRVEAAMATLRAWYGPLPSRQTLSIMEIPDGWGSQASLTGGIVQTAAAFRDTSRLVEVYHELTHLWNATDAESPSPRWNEGFATYQQYRMAAELDGMDLAAARESLLERLRQTVQGTPSLRETPFRDYGSARLTDASYRVGGVMFALLHAHLGSDAFDAAYRRLWSEHATTAVTVEDLQGAFQDADPHGDLGPFLREWIDTAEWSARLEAASDFQGLLDASFPAV
ncbi:MAG: hypothetical protein R3E10_18470 [Gemmatimonadota bacterium]